MSLPVPFLICYVTTVLIRTITRNQIPGEKLNQSGVNYSTVVRTATHSELTTRLAESRIRVNRGSGFRPLGSHPCALFLNLIAALALSSGSSTKLN
jgi:hypothetical protein